tara:strand:- start:2899 stop:3108 length:210 start_codon:yes stop_codon:yes gene_type:complete
MYTDKPTISLEVQALSESLMVIANTDYTCTACPLTISLFAASWVWTCRDIMENYLWPAEDLMEVKYGDS